MKFRISIILVLFGLITLATSSGCKRIKNYFNSSKDLKEYQLGLLDGSTSKAITVLGNPDDIRYSNDCNCGVYIYYDKTKAGTNEDVLHLVLLYDSEKKVRKVVAVNESSHFYFGDHFISNIYRKTDVKTSKVTGEIESKSSYTKTKSSGNNSTISSGAQDVPVQLLLLKNKIDNYILNVDTTKLMTMWLPVTDGRFCKYYYSENNGRLFAMVISNQMNKTADRYYYDNYGNLTYCELETLISKKPFEKATIRFYVRNNQILLSSGAALGNHIPYSSNIKQADPDNIYKSYFESFDPNAGD